MLVPEGIPSSVCLRSPLLPSYLEDLDGLLPGSLLTGAAEEDMRLGVACCFPLCAPRMPVLVLVRCRKSEEHTRPLANSSQLMVPNSRLFDMSFLFRDGVKTIHIR